MAIDTENKRRSVQAAWFGIVQPVPDGTIDANDRAASSWLYSGLTAGGPVPTKILRRMQTLVQQLRHRKFLP